MVLLVDFKVLFNVVVIFILKDFLSFLFYLSLFFIFISKGDFGMYFLLNLVRKYFLFNK